MGIEAVKGVCQGKINCPDNSIYNVYQCNKRRI